MINKKISTVSGIAVLIIIVSIIGGVIFIQNKNDGSDTSLGKLEEIPPKSNTVSEKCLDYAKIKTNSKYRQSKWFNDLLCAYEGQFLSPQGIGLNNLFSTKEEFLSENKDIYIFVPEFAEFGCYYLFRYDIKENEISIPISPPNGCVGESFETKGDYIYVTGVQGDGGSGYKYEGKYFFDSETLDIKKRGFKTNDWQSYSSKSRGYAISYPEDFLIQENSGDNINLLNYNPRDENNYWGGPNNIKIQIQKHNISQNYDSVEEYREYLFQVEDEFVDKAKVIGIGDFISVSQYTKNGPGGAFMTYTAFDEKNNVYYDILVFEPAYSNNIELVEKIIETFILL